jgi:hypothetical protein
MELCQRDSKLFRQGTRKEKEKSPGKIRGFEVLLSSSGFF